MFGNVERKEEPVSIHTPSKNIELRTEIKFTYYGLERGGLLKSRNKSTETEEFILRYQFIEGKNN